MSDDVEKFLEEYSNDSKFYDLCPISKSFFKDLIFYARYHGPVAYIKAFQIANAGYGLDREGMLTIIHKLMKINEVSVINPTMSLDYEEIAYEINVVSRWIPCK